MLSSTLFPVKEVPATMVNEKGELNHIGSTGYKFIVREDTEQVLSCMTDEYRMVTNKELTDVATPILEKHNAVLTEAISLGDGQKTVYKWKIPDIKIKIAEDDIMNPEIIIKNSYDGSLQVHILAGAFRLVCSNGMIIGVTLGHKNYKHSINNINLDHMDEAVEKTIDHSIEVGSEFEFLANTVLDDRDIVRLVELFPSQMSEFLVQYLIANRPSDYWGLLNAATFLATHHMKRHYQSTHNLETKIFPNIKKWADKAAQA
jgi:hypothetical protein|tara:strand:- start:1524 stop:2303 length:780 start_codon:yes stop_codon:yes gene_type:complete